MYIFLRVICYLDFKESEFEMLMFIVIYRVLYVKYSGEYFFCVFDFIDLIVLNVIKYSYFYCFYFRDLEIWV